MRLSKNNIIRLRWAYLYLLLGMGCLIDFVLIKIFSIEYKIVDYAVIIWCLGWSAIGIFLGLYNSRKDHGDNTSSNKHYITYFLFVWLVSALSAFVMFGSNMAISIVHGYASAILVGVVVGFAGDKLAGKIFDLK